MNFAYVDGNSTWTVFVYGFCLCAREGTEPFSGVSLFVHAGHLNVGMIGIKYLLPALTAAGYVDIATQVVSQPTYPGYGYMLANGEGTLWERWEGGQHIDAGMVFP